MKNEILKIQSDRRNFIKTSSLGLSSLIISINIPTVTFANSDGKKFTANAWLEIFENEEIIFYLDKSEMGQGVMTALPMIISEELEVDPETLIIKNADANRNYINPEIGSQTTGGSTSVKASYIPLREAGAQAREMLITAAAKQWGIPSKECFAEGGKVHNKKNKESKTYGSLVRDASKLPVPKVRLKKQLNFNVIGRSFRRLDNRDKITGSGIFGIDVSVPNMLNAVVLRSPTFEGQVESFVGTEALKIEGVKKIFKIRSGIAIVAEKHWQLLSAIDKVKIKWNLGELKDINNQSILKNFKDAIKKQNTDLEAVNTPDKLHQTYYAPYLAHATMEPVNCSAFAEKNKCEIWAPTQAQGLLQQVAVEELALSHDQVKVNTTYIGGGFGRRLVKLECQEVVQISKEMNKPIKLLYTREHDMKTDAYRPASFHSLKANISKNKEITNWQHIVAAPSIIAQQVPDLVGPILPEALPEFLKRFIGKSVQGLLNMTGAPIVELEGAENIAYNVMQNNVEYVQSDPGIPVGFWRSVGHSYNAFAVESFIDEIAHHVNIDPAEYRVDLLKGKIRHLKVLNEVLSNAKWGNAPEGHFQGVAVHESFGSVVAEVAEISINPFKIHKVFCAIDCGLVINPDIVKCQMEGSIVFGLTAALYGNITIENGGVKEGNFDSQPLLRMNEMPEIEVMIISSNEHPQGVGEPGVPPIAPALANALFQANGIRQRSLPLKV